MGRTVLKIEDIVFANIHTDNRESRQITCLFFLYWTALKATFISNLNQISSVPQAWRTHVFDDYLNKDLKSVNTWLSSNKVKLNLTKTEFLIITSRQRRVYLSDNPSLTINNFPIEQVSSTKSLGVSIDENLSWNTHIETLCKKISLALGLIKRIRDFVPFYTLLNIFNGV